VIFFISVENDHLEKSRPMVPPRRHAGISACSGSSAQLKLVFFFTPASHLIGLAGRIPFCEDIVDSRIHPLDLYGCEMADSQDVDLDRIKRQAK
jgi:hypothetical protein